MKKIISFLIFTVIYGTPIFAQEYTINNDANKDDCHCYTLTPDQNNKSGSVWNNNKINLTQPFDFKFDVNLGCNDDNGADGMAFVLQPISTSVGGQGGGMGYSGVQKSVGVTLDDFKNDHDNDPAYDHIDIQYNGNVTHTSNPPPISAVADNVEDCQWHILRVKWEPSLNKLTVYFDGVERISTTRNIIADIFGGDPMVYWGFTAATGGSKNAQQFCTALTPKFYFLPDQKKCVGEVVEFKDSTQSFGPVKSWLWEFPDGTKSIQQNPAKTFPVAGDYNIKLTVEGADLCIETKTFPVRIGSFPVVDFTHTNVCANVAANFEDKSTVAVGTKDKWSWDLALGITSSQQNPSRSYAALVNGTNNSFDVKLTVTTKEGCTSTASHPFLVYGLPIAKFDQEPACEGVPSKFIDKSDFGGLNNAAITGTINKWNWNFGAGVSSIQQNPLQLLTAANTQATLIVTTSNGCESNALSKPINTSASPTSLFTIPANQKYCINNPVVFNNASTPSAFITKYEWDFGDGSTDNVNANPSHAYTIAKDYIISLTVTNASGCINKFEKTITIADKPQAAFTVQNTCAEKTVSFTDNSTGGIIEGWNWNLGFGAVASEKDPTKLYAALVNGTNNDFDVSLTVINKQGCVSDLVSKPLRIYTTPVAKFSQAGACTGIEYKFKDESFFSTTNDALNGTINKWNWDFGAGIISDAENPSLLLNAAINTSAILIATSSNGCESLPKTETITSALLPVADFEPGTICTGANATLTDKSKTLDGSAITSWIWDLGNGSQASIKNPSTVYANEGTASVTLDVKAANGCGATVTKIITISPLPQAIIAPFTEQLCENRLVQLTDASQATAGTTIKNWSWKVDNSNPVATQNPLHYFTAGNHSVTLSVKDNIGCESTIVQDQFNVNAKPVVDYSFPQGACKKDEVQFTGINNSSEAVDQWYWTFGDNSIGNVQSPMHIYSSNKIYTVKLYAISDKGCYSDTIQNKFISIYGTDAFAGQDIIATFNQPIQLSATGGETYVWTPATGLSNANIADPIAVLKADQTYTVTAYTPQGCESSDQIKIKVYAGPEIYVPTAFTPNGSGINDVLRAVPAGITLLEEFTIYNRLGQPIFTTTDYKKGWDGQYKGTHQNAGIYVWIAKGIDYKGNKIFRKGTVLLIR